jgi:uncharacterized lipoprotein YmbA
MAKALAPRGRYIKCAVLVGVLVCVAVCLQGCGTVPTIHYFTLDKLEPSATSRAVSAGPVLRVERLGVAEPYADRRMVYRTNQREVGFWDFCMWAQPLDRMVTARIAERLSESGVFRKVDSFPYAWDKADLILKGAVLAFEEVDRDDGWYGRVKINLELIEPASGDVLWSDKVDLERKAQSKNAPAVVDALAQALDDAVDQAAAGMKGAVEQSVKRGPAAGEKAGDGEN